MGHLRSPEAFIFDSYKHVVPPGPRHFTFSNTLIPHYLSKKRFTRCGEFNFRGMVDAQLAIVEDELLTDQS